MVTTSRDVRMPSSGSVLNYPDVLSAVLLVIIYWLHFFSSSSCKCTSRNSLRSSGRHLRSNRFEGGSCRGHQGAESMELSVVHLYLRDDGRADGGHGTESLCCPLAAICSPMATKVRAAAAGAALSLAILAHGSSTFSEVSSSSSLSEESLVTVRKTTKPLHVLKARQFVGL